MSWSQTPASERGTAATLKTPRPATARGRVYPVICHVKSWRLTYLLEIHEIVRRNWSKSPTDLILIKFDGLYRHKNCLVNSICQFCQRTKMNVSCSEYCDDMRKMLFKHRPTYAFTPFLRCAQIYSNGRKRLVELVVQLSDCSERERKQSPVQQEVLGRTYKPTFFVL
jgi:hypothetical protein